MGILLLDDDSKFFLGKGTPGLTEEVNEAWAVGVRKLVICLENGCVSPKLEEGALWVLDGLAQGSGES